MKRIYYIGLVLIIILYGKSLSAQAIAPPIIYEPLERPKPLVFIQADEPEKLMEKIKETISQYGFTISDIDTQEKYIEAKRSDDPPHSKDYDKIIIWLERDIEKSNKLRVHFLYGRYMEIRSKTIDIYRVKINQAKEEERIGKLKLSLKSIKFQ